jgi:DNA polymerase-4
MKTTSKIIFHIDLNAFFASCEIADNPDLLGKPVVVAPESKRRGIVLTASYEARKFGVRSAMRVQDAMRLCPYLVVVDSNMSLYSHYSRLFFEYLVTITKELEPASIDEGYLDLTSRFASTPNQLLETEILKLAQEIQTHLLTTYKLPCSIGIGPNKFLAKIASDMKKPLGITVLRKREIETYLWPLPIEAMPGVGKKTCPKLLDLGIKTIGDLAKYEKLEILQEVVGKNNATYLKERAYGIDDSVVESSRFDEVLSVSNSHTFDSDIYDSKTAKLGLKILCNTVSNRLIKKELKSHTLTLQIKYSTFQSITRARSLEIGTNDANAIYQVMEDLFDEFYDEDFGVRLLGVAASKLIASKDEIVQLSIFDQLSITEKENSVYELISGLQSQFGKEIITRGVKSKKGFDKYDKD